MIDIERQDKIRIHVTFVAIDHEIRILPEVPCAIALASVAGSGVLVRSHHGAGLQAISIFDFDGVLLVVEDAAQRLVQVRNVIAAIEIVVDEDLPIACNVVNLALKKVELAKSQRLAPLHQSGQEIFEPFRLRIKVHEDKDLPSFDFYRNKTIFLALEIFHAIELRHPFERPIQAIVPPMVGTMKDGGTTTRFGHDLGGVVSANVIEGAKLAVGSTHSNDGLAG